MKRPCSSQEAILVWGEMATIQLATCNTRLAFQRVLLLEMYLKENDKVATSFCALSATKNGGIVLIKLKYVMLKKALFNK